MSDPPSAGPPAGWYPDDELERTQRYWDGAAWTEHRAPAASTTKPTAPALVPVGWICAILLPLVGFIIGFVLIGRADTSDQGLWMMITSVAAAALGTLVVLGGL